MDEVEQDRSTAGLAPPPATDVEVVVGLVEQSRAYHGDDRPEPAALHDLAGFGHDGAVVAVVPGQHRHPGLLPGLDQPGGALDGVADGLLDDHRDPGCDGFQAAVDVHLVGGGEDDPVGLVPLEQLGERLVERHAELLGQLGAGGAGIDDRGQLGVQARVDLLDVPLADHACARDRDPYRAHLSSSSSVTSVASFRGTGTTFS